MNSRLQLAAMIVCGALSLMLARALPAQDPMGLAVGTKAPGAMVQTLDGKRIDLASFIGKGPVVLVKSPPRCHCSRDKEPVT